MPNFYQGKASQVYLYSTFHTKLLTQTTSGKFRFALLVWQRAHSSPFPIRHNRGTNQKRWGRALHDDISAGIL